MPDARLFICRGGGGRRPRRADVGLAPHMCLDEAAAMLSVLGAGNLDLDLVIAEWDGDRRGAFRWSFCR